MPRSGQDKDLPSRLHQPSSPALSGATLVAADLEDVQGTLNLPVKC